MIDQGQSLNTIMNQMVARVDALLPPDKRIEFQHKEWPLIELYIRIDDVLAELFKQYQDALNRVNALAKISSKHDPLLDVTRDVLDSAKAAVTTRYIELQEDEEFQGTAASEVQKISIEDPYTMQNKAVRKKQEKDDVYSAMALFLWAALIMEQRREIQTLRASFQKTLKAVAA